MDIMPIKAIIGKLSDNKKEAIMRKKLELLKTQSEFKKIGIEELPKTRDDIQLFETANILTNALISKFGLPSLDISSNVFHVVKEEDRWRVHFYLGENTCGCLGFFDSKSQMIMFLEEFNGLSYYKKLDSLIHEILHLKSYQSLQIKRGGKESCYRNGLTIKGSYFRAIDEALTQTTADLLVSKSTGRDYEGISYKKEKYILETLICGIFNKNLERFKDKNEVFDMFLRAYFTGNVMPLARIIKKTFGYDAFGFAAKHDFNFLLEDAMIS
ncbi:MAG: hypothetical protein UT05_C0006G0041 [Parcubacteria group bacterium GW2011_GWF2_38_76]|nr:MAG: hypothetical protein UT05_C0006G0041 [Parcubacteria group bacterium GW2011_GWF2_38_76]HBM45859.1 hypothetical protein [Patescibacteria group bacterium]